jgi:5-methyltetrahydrofolate--homocysteine methyltransferase
MPTLNFSEEDWDRVRRDTMAWWSGDLPRPLVYLAEVDPQSGGSHRGYQSNYPLNMPAEAVAECYEPVMAATHYYGDAFPWLWINFGPGIAAGFLGADVNSVTDPSETVWFTPARQVPLADLSLDYDPANAWWRRVRDVTAAFVSRVGGRLQASITDLGGNLDILASFRTTQQLLVDVLEQPEEVLRLSRQITAAWLRYYDELDAIVRPACPGTSCWAPIWSTGKTYMLQCDFAYMIGPKMFERFVLPDLAACCEHLDHGFYHLDGKGQIAHLDLLLSIPRLRGIQWIPGDGQPPADQWLPLLKRIRDAGKLCQVYVTPEGARRIVQNLGGRGFLLDIYHDDNSFADPEVAAAFLRTLAQDDIAA